MSAQRCVGSGAIVSDALTLYVRCRFCGRAVVVRATGPTTTTIGLVADHDRPVTS